MKFKSICLFSISILLIHCTEKKTELRNEKIIKEEIITDIPVKNRQIVEVVKKYGPSISSTYEKAVCTELVIQVLEKVSPLNEIDKKRIRIITEENIQELLKQNSKIPKGVYYALTENGTGKPIEIVMYLKEILFSFGLKLGALRNCEKY